MKPNTKKALAGGLVVAVLVLPFALRGMRGEHGTPVQMQPAAARAVRPTILASGTLAYGTEVNLTSEVVAKVDRILVAEGDTVQKGQLLLTLDPKIYRNAIDRESAGRRQGTIDISRQRATLQLRAAQYARAQKLASQQLIDRNSLEEARLALEQARAELATSTQSLQRQQAVLGDAYEQLSKTEIRAPISGRIVDLPIKVGETAIPSTNALAGAKLMKIADVSALTAELKVDEADIGQVSIGQAVDVYPAAYPDTALHGRVDKIALAPTVEGQARAYKVTVSLTLPGSLNPRSGMSARADIYLGDGRPQLAVPVEAVMDDGDELAAAAAEGDSNAPKHEEAKATVAKTYVWIERDGRARKQSVKTGVADDRWQVIASGLKSGDKVIVGPAKTLRTLHDGDRVSEKSAKELEAAKDGDAK
ncbi:efflux RND transporter periplasmic adaptor subunit [Lysobacter sp. TY2-98]|uniref:efflux RND transporter periplasmic adaptor subunit n=1 Tax=Lysobacter sp. TY2-98 TaxID=2290922 RepID=UPI000E208F82|nr:efflux RND transporter periplasmic adaptor subunit [Lysobacter sp. TY2-98]AXK73219.1 efflux RND transporter periplasmic adaptor subunit [Lysobacter sp. TY2-98]